MGKYQEIVNLIEHSVPDWTSLKVVPRGTPIFQDLLMSGQIRFARRTGANFAVLNPDNQCSLSANAQVDQQILYVDQVLNWLEEGALLTFNQTEMLQVSTWDAINNVVFITEPLSANRSAGTNLYLWATPLVVHFDSAVNATQIYVRSRYQLVNGDAIAFPVSTSINSLKQIDVTLATAAGIDVDPNFPYIYVLDLAEPMPIALIAEETSIYIRAFPAYQSQLLNVPSLHNSQIGPFILDYVASPLDSIISYKETFAIRTVAPGNTMVEGGANYFKTVEHNHPVVNRQIFAENMIFWKMLRGYGGFVLPNKFQMTATLPAINGQYAARVSSRMVPNLPPGIRYDFKVASKVGGTFIVIPYPYAAQKYTLNPTTTNVVSISTPVDGQPIQRLDFLFYSAVTDATVLISNATLPVNPVVQNFQYTYVFRVLGNSNFQATSIIVKPYFLSLSDLTARYDEGKKYNSGFVYL